MSTAALRCSACAAAAPSKCLCSTRNALSLHSATHAMMELAAAMPLAAIAQSTALTATISSSVIKSAPLTNAAES